MTVLEPCPLQKASVCRIVNPALGFSTEFTQHVMGRKGGTPAAAQLSVGFIMESKREKQVEGHKLLLKFHWE